MMQTTISVVDTRCKLREILRAIVFVKCGHLQGGFEKYPEGPGNEVEPPYKFDEIVARIVTQVES